MEVGGPRQATNAEEDWIRTPNHHPAIISQELFDAAQEQLRVKGEPLRRRELNTAKRYAAQMAPALRGKVICGHCGHTMIISSTKNAAFHCRFTRAAPDAACHKLRIQKSELESVVLESIKRQAKVVLQAGLRASEVQAICSPAAAEYMERIERLREDKQRLYESLVLGGVSPEEYKTQKAAIEAALDNAVHVHEAILSESKKSLPDEDSLQAAAKALKARKLSDALIDLLIGKVLVYPDNRIEVVWKLEGFLICLAHYDKSEVLKYVG